MRLLQDHPHAVALRGVHEDGRAYHLVMECCAGGELFDRIVGRGSFGEADAAALMRGLLSFVAYAASKGVVHRCVRAVVGVVGASVRCMGVQSLRRAAALLLLLSAVCTACMRALS